VTYQFSGSVEAIYASLVVRLNYTDYFKREEQWKYSCEFSRGSSKLGFQMGQIEEGTGELEIFFYDGISDFDRVTFIRFITSHLQSRGIDLKERINLFCPKCEREIKDVAAINNRIRDGKLFIPCQYCDASVLIPSSIEEVSQRPILCKKARC
jgi:hypothetical protein